MRTEIVTNKEGSSHFPKAQEGGQDGHKSLLMSGEGVFPARAPGPTRKAQ